MRLWLSSQGCARRFLALRKFVNPLNLLLICAFAQQTQTAFAQEEKWTHYGVRPLAMGNAFVAVADDFNALFYNPAGLARLKTWKGEFLNPTLSLGKDTQSFIGEAQDMGGGGGKDTEGLLELLEARNGQNQYIGFGLTPHLVFPNFGLGIGAEVVASFVFHRYPSVYINAGPRIIVPISGAINLMEDKLSLGFGVRGHIKGGLDHEFTISEINAFKKSAGEEDEPELADYMVGGTAVGFDFGLLYTPIKLFEPTIGLSVIDIGGAKYTAGKIQGEEVDAPEVEQAAINAGFSFKPIRHGPYYLMYAIDGHALNQSYSFSKKLNTGLEFGLGSILKFGVGLHQGYFTGGAQIDVGILTLRVASYAEEMGAVAGTTQDRRYVLQLKLLI